LRLRAMARDDSCLSGGGLETEANPTALTCPSCGAPVAPAAAICSYCQATLAWGGAAPKTPNRSVRDAVGTWAKSVFGAPSDLADLVRAVQVRDEVLERLLTVVVRRDVTEERIPTTQRKMSLARIDPTAVDPFGIAPDALRAASEYVTSCAQCGGSGSCSCRQCGGDGRARCSNCSGSGQERRYYKKSSRLVKCTVCRGAGRVACGTCDGRGVVTCHGCTGSGHQVAWLAYSDASRSTVVVVPDSPVLVAHKHLREVRTLAASELSGFGTLVSLETDGPVPIDGRHAVHSSVVRQQADSLDPRLERITSQQYLKLAIVRRDATYEMCGTSGVLVLSGCDLVGASTPEALRPIHRRLYVWVAIAVGLVGTAWAMAATLCGPTVYFSKANAWVQSLSWSAATLTLWFAGGALRELRPGLKFGRFRATERLAGLVAPTAACGAIILSIVARPRVAEVERALAAGDTDRAQLVVDALVATQGEVPDVRDASDAVMLSRGAKLAGDEKLKVLDLVASRGGRHVTQAAEAARTERLLEVQQAIDGRRPADAIARIDKWFPKWKTDPEIATRRSLAEDVAFAACADDPCRYSTAAAANDASTTPERLARAAAAKAALLTSLDFAEMPGEPLLARLQRLGSVLALATQPVVAGASDLELSEKAKTAGAFAGAERGKVALVNADEPVAAELLGPLTERDPKVATATVSGVSVSLALDAQRKCRGVYLVGPTPGSRLLDAGGDAPARARLLSQVFGHSTSVRPPAPGGTTSRWTEGATPVVARWKDGQLVELRIGDATP
jgi:hypothetical protein